VLDRSLTHLVLALALAIAWTSPASAATPVLVGPGMDPDDALAEARRVLPGEDLVLGGALAETLNVADDDLVVISATAELCTEEATRPLDAELVGLRSIVDDMDYGKAGDTVDALLTRLPCLAANSTSEQLFDVYLLGGIAAFYDSDPKRSSEYFARAAALDPSRPWPADYPPAPATAYLSAFKEVMASPPGNLRAKVSGDILLDGKKWEGEPRLYAGRHLIWVQGVRKGAVIDVAQRSALPNGEVVVTSGGALVSGLLQGDEHLEPRLYQLLREASWDRAVLASNEGVLVYEDRAFTVPAILADELAREARRSAGPAPATIAGIGVLGAGVALGGAGLGMYFQSANEGRIRVGEPLKTREEYDALVARNRAGLGLAIAGAGTATAGIVMAIVGAADKAKKRRSGELALAPWLVAGPNGAAIGVSGRLR